MGEDDQDVANIPLKYFCADVSWISKFHRECEFLMHPTFLDTKKSDLNNQNTNYVKKRSQEHQCYIVETDTFKRI